MKNSAFRHFLFLIVFFVSCAVCSAAGVSGVDVTVRQTSGGKTMKQTKSDASGNFVVGSLPEGAYTLEFRAKNLPDMKTKQVTIAVAGTKKSGSLDKIPGDHLVGGVALKVEATKGGNVTGQITTGPKMVWVPPALGSNRPGHWVEADSAEAKTSKTRSHMSKDALKKMQENAYNPQG
ncbi:MAG TPA: carboxypeptidase-like regulatory domain-containing protein [Chthoniobacterales bacterium]|nr:carboxypeptidase-like regulatory domain-containing protein [Chthoniobacterales bacterium]